MNQDMKESNDSDDSSSPAASGSSGMREEELSSTETTPPPNGEHAYGDSKRFSNNSSSIYSRSYQSMFSMPSGSNSRPMTADTSIGQSYRGDEDPQDLAAAVGLLSCSYGTPKSGPTNSTADVPPVPPLPEKYQSKVYSNYRNQGDVEMDDESSNDGDGRNDDMDDGMFGKMDA